MKPVRQWGGAIRGGDVNDPAYHLAAGSDQLHPCPVQRKQFLFIDLKGKKLQVYKSADTALSVWGGRSSCSTILPG